MLPDYENRLDQLFANAFNTNDDAMLDWVEVKFELKQLRNQCNSCGLKKSMDEALNSGDGVYRP